MSELLEKALAYAARGLAVFPLKPGGKTPATAHGFKNASTDTDKIRAWWESIPDANIGIATGKVSGIVVIDVDVKNDKPGHASIAELLDEDAKRTARCETPTTGLHFYFVYPTGATVGCTVDHPLPGLDVRGDGGYVVAPPSIVDGKKYTWLSGDRGILHLPESVLEKISTRPIVSAPEEKTAKGSRNITLTRFAGALRRAGASAETILASLNAHNKVACDPPLPAGEVERIAVSVARYSPPAQPGNFAPEVSTAASLGAEHLAPIRWAIPGILPEGVSLFVAHPKQKKTLTAIHVALAKCFGGKVFGELPVDKCGVMFLALEDNKRRLKKRLLEISAGMGQATLPESLHFIMDWPKSDIDSLRKYLAENPEIKFVVIDTLAKFREIPDGRSSSYLTDYQALEGLQKLAGELGISILIIHHLRKMVDEDPLNQVSGTNGLSGSADSIWVLTRTRGKDDANLFITGRDVEEEKDLALVWDKTLVAWRIAGNAAEVVQSNQRQEIIDQLKTGPKNSRELAAMVGVKHDTLYRLLRRMHADGVVTKTKNMYTLAESPADEI